MKQYLNLYIETAAVKRLDLRRGKLSRGKYIEQLLGAKTQKLEEGDAEELTIAERAEQAIKRSFNVKKAPIKIKRKVVERDVFSNGAY